MTRICSLILKMPETGPSEVAFLATVVNHEAAAIGAVLLTIAGMGLCWQSPRYRMSIEERAKDGVLSSEQAQRKIQFMEWFAPAVALTGCALLTIFVLL